MVKRTPHDKPVEWLRRFSRRLGWARLRCRGHMWKEQGLLITWYESGVSGGSRSHFCFQINESPIGQTSKYSAAVYAIRYRICTGWHSFSLGLNASCIRLEADRLHTWLHRSWFDSPASRRRYRHMHPECCGWTWRRIREDRLPYEIGDR
jgi:hypothetical protein